MTRQPYLESVASVVQRLAVLLAAGVAPASAWNYLDAARPLVADRVAALVAAGEPAARSIAASLDGVPVAEASVWRGLSAAWFVATEAGAPLAPSLRDFAISLRALANAEREIDVALAAPIATARMVMVLPVVAVLFGLVLGFNTIETLATTPVGWGCLAVAAALMLIARAWNRRLLRSAQPKQLTPGLRFELMAIGVAGGGSLDRARATVAAALDLSLLDAGEEDGVEAVLDLSRRAGVPAAELLRSEAEESRRTARADAEKRAAVLAVRLMLPLGLCILPAFMALGVVPLVVSVIASTVSTF